LVQDIKIEGNSNWYLKLRENLVLSYQNYWLQDFYEHTMTSCVG